MAKPHSRNLRWGGVGSHPLPGADPVPELPGGLLNMPSLDKNMVKIDPSGARDLAAEVLDEQGRLRVLPAAYWAATSATERFLLGRHHGVSGLPTVELVEHLRGLIAGRSAIEIGAGNGVLAQALGIPATDSRMQEWPRIRREYAQLGQVPVRYGDNVVACDAARAVRRYKPQVVLACWVTHKYNRARDAAGGNRYGVDEEDILANCQTYLFIGNEEVHRGKSIWGRPHQIDFPDFVYSRAANGTRDFIAVWPGGK